MQLLAGLGLKDLHVREQSRRPSFNVSCTARRGELRPLIICHVASQGIDRLHAPSDVALLSQVKRLSVAAVSTETSLAETQAKLETLTRYLKGVQQKLDVTEGLERDLKRLGREAEEMNKNTSSEAEEKQVRQVLVE